MTCMEEGLVAFSWRSVNVKGRPLDMHASHTYKVFTDFATEKKSITFPLLFLNF